MDDDKICKLVIQHANDTEFCRKHENKGAPIGIIAFAKVVMEYIVNAKVEFHHHFKGISIIVPDVSNPTIDPIYHSIIGQKLLLVDWIRTHGMDVTCPAKCGGNLENIRTNFSKSQTLYPIFNLDGPPSWCMVQKMRCACCKRQFEANESAVLMELPLYVSSTYPVDIQYASPNRNSHLSRNATEVFRHLMLTYANGELCSKILYDVINRSFMSRVKAYYSYARANSLTVPKYVSRKGGYVKAYPPLGDTIRDLWNEASSSQLNPWRISDNERHTREMQSVKCPDGGVIAQDHTFEIVKNYPRSLGAKACWDVATSTGEIAAAVLVPTTKTIHFSHAAIQLTRREGFNPKAMYSDTWPNKKEYWEAVIPGVKGRLGLFHYEKRILSTLRKKHIDYGDALTDLLSAVYVYCSQDYEKLLVALKDGTLSPTEKKYSSEEIAELKGSKLFRDRYAKYLRKDIREPQTMIQLLDDWFCKYKVNASDNSRPGRGRIDPIRGFSLFTPDTKQAVENCKEKATYLSDPFPFEQMYDQIRPNPRCSHQLTEYLSKRGESKLEAYHDRAANFANTGMRASLADSLSLAGTAIHNLAIRHKRSIIPRDLDERKIIPSTWEKVLPFHNHTELQFVNVMAEAVGVEAPFPNAEVLQEDTGERFFSQYMTNNFHVPLERWDSLDQCLCSLCVAPPFQRQLTIPNNDDESEVPTPSTNADSPQQQPTSPVPLPAVDVVARPLPLPPPQPNPFVPPQLLPTVPMYYIAPSYCCDKYREWCGRRIGRPPHHPLCNRQPRRLVYGYGYPQW